ncbi:MAG: MBL fold metallo-hydrolase [Anaerolineae bacterium]
MIERLPIGLLGSNVYLVYDDQNEGMLVDPGVVEPEPLLRAIRERDLVIHYILNTHGHFDHVAGSAHLHRLGASLALHPADRELMLGGGGSMALGVTFPSPPPPEVELADGTEITVGSLNIQVVHTPGHTPGSVCLFIPEDRALLTGDTLFAGSVGRTDLPGGSHRMLEASLRRLMDLPDDIRVYPGHGSPTTIGHERRHNPWIQALRT